jgi:hypothetical protein
VIATTGAVYARFCAKGVGRRSYCSTMSRRRGSFGRGDAERARNASVIDERAESFARNPRGSQGTGEKASE